MQSIQTELAKLASEQAEKLSEIEKPKDLEDKDYKAKTEKIFSTYQERGNGFIKLYIELNTSMKYSYFPEVNFVPLEKEIDLIDTSISISSVGIKLKNISKFNSITSRIINWFV